MTLQASAIGRLLYRKCFHLHSISYTSQNVAPTTGFEPVTYSLEGCCYYPIELSGLRMVDNKGLQPLFQDLKSFAHMPTSPITLKWLQVLPIKLMFQKQQVLADALTHSDFESEIGDDLVDVKGI